MPRFTAEQIMQMTPGMDQFVQSQGLVPIGQNEDGSIRYGMANDPDMNISPGQFSEEYADPRRLTEFQREQLRDQGVIQLADYGGSDASNWSWINQNSGTNFQSGTDYLNYLYGNQGEQVGDYYVLPEGMTYDQYANAPLQYNPADTGMMKWMPYILAAVGTAGMAGMLPGTTSIFGGAGAAGAAGGAPAFTGGASGAGIAGAAGGGGTLSGLTAAEMAAIGGSAGGLAGAGGGGSLSGMGGTEFVGGASGGGISGGGAGSSGALSGTGGGNMFSGLTGFVDSGGFYGDLLKGGLNLVGSAINASAAGDASDAMLAGTAAATAEQRRQYDQSRADLMPFMQTGYAANARLAGLLGIDPAQAGSAGYGDLTRRFTMADRDADPVYQSGLQFGLDEGIKGINERARASGMYDSGATLKALTRYGNDYGSTKANESYNRFNTDATNIYNRLAGISGGGQTATNTVTSAGANMANQVGNLETQAGNARAAGVVGGANAWGNALTGISGMVDANRDRDLLGRILGGRGY